MKKVSLILSFLALTLVTFAFTPAENFECNETENITCVEEDITSCETGVEVNMNEFFGTGRFYGCYISTNNSAVTYELRPQMQGVPSIFGTIGCQSDIVTLQPFLEYDVLITCSTQIWIFLRWEFCNIPGGVPGISLPAGADQDVGSIFIPC